MQSKDAIGVGKAKELIYSGDMIGAQEALDLGLINHVFGLEALIEEAMTLSGEIAIRSGVVLSLIKSAVNRGTETDLETASIFEIDCFAL